MAEGHPALAKKYLETFVEILEQQPDDTPRIDRLLRSLDRVVDVRPPRDVVVVGCGPRPRLIRVLRERGYRVVGVEPVPSFVTAANEYLGGSNVLQGWAEAMPLASSSQHLILCEAVLEHVDSPRAALDEIHRVLRPGGIAFISTTNRLKLHLRGENGEFNVPFFNWFPRLVRESYVFRHLHYDPTLANYTLLPAVHWFTFAELCMLGRNSGFGQFYSLLDLLHGDDGFLVDRWWKRALLRPLQRSAWLRALALTQFAASIVMLKRAGRDSLAPALPRPALAGEESGQRPRGLVSAQA